MTRKKIQNVKEKAYLIDNDPDLFILNKDLELPKYYEHEDSIEGFDSFPKEIHTNCKDLKKLEKGKWKLSVMSLINLSIKNEKTLIPKKIGFVRFERINKKKEKIKSVKMFNVPYKFFSSHIKGDFIKDFNNKADKIINGLRATGYEIDEPKEETDPKVLEKIKRKKLKSNIMYIYKQFYNWGLSNNSLDFELTCDYITDTLRIIIDFDDIEYIGYFDVISVLMDLGKDGYLTTRPSRGIHAYYRTNTKMKEFIKDN